jgi:hypothetical protein
VVAEEGNHHQAKMEKIKGKETEMENQRAIPATARLWR